MKHMMQQQYFRLPWQDPLVDHHKCTSTILKKATENWPGCLSQKGSLAKHVWNNGCQREALLSVDLRKPLYWLHWRDPGPPGVITNKMQDTVSGTDLRPCENLSQICSAVSEAMHTKQTDRQTDRQTNSKLNIEPMTTHDEARFWLRIAIFLPTSATSDAPVTGSPSEYCHNIWYGKTRMVGLVWQTEGDKILTIICSLVSAEYTNVTDNRTPCNYIDRTAAISRVSRGKKVKRSNTSEKTQNAPEPFSSM